MLDGGELLIDAAGDNATFSLKRLDITFPKLCLLNTPPCTCIPGAARPLDHSRFSLISPAIIPGNMAEYDAVHHVRLVDYGIFGSYKSFPSSPSLSQPFYTVIRKTTSKWSQLIRSNSPPVIILFGGLSP